MKVSVVVCTYAEERFADVSECVDALLAQTYDDVEVVLVVDGTESVHERALERYGDEPQVDVHCNDENLGLLESRNRGAELASGDVVAFVDDDAIPDERWVEALVRGYEESDALAVGGKMTPAWVDGRPSYLPPEFYWLVGVTHRGFADGPCEVRNTFGSNLSVRREAFLDVGGFDPAIGGRKGDANLQGGETELCARLRREHGEGVWYVPEAEVAHKVFAYRTEPRWLLERAFWQGYSKRAMSVLVPDAGDEETDFLRQIVVDATPRRLRALLRRDEPARQLLELVTLWTFTGLVGLGYLYGVARWR